MRRIGLVAIILAALAGGVGCRNACDDLQDKWQECCSHAPKDVTCTPPDTSGESPDDCQAFLDIFECPYH